LPIKNVLREVPKIDPSSTVLVRIAEIIPHRDVVLIFLLLFLQFEIGVKILRRNHGHETPADCNRIIKCQQQFWKAGSRLIAYDLYQSSVFARKPATPSYFRYSMLFLTFPLFKTFFEL